MKNKEKIIDAVICIVFIFIGVLLGSFIIDYFAIDNFFADVFIRGVVFFIFFRLGEAIAKLINRIIKKS